MRGFQAFVVLALAAGASCADLPAGVVLRFSCDEIRSGPALPDMTGSNHSGRVSNVRAMTAGRLAGACEFTGKNSYVAVPDFPELNSKCVTLCAWFRTVKVEGADRTLFDRQPANGYALKITGGNRGARQGRLCFTVCGHDCLSDANLADNAWHHAVAAYDGENLKLYVDGQLQQQVTVWRGEIPANGQELTIGMNRSSAAPKEREIAFDGMLDEVIVFSRGLGEEDVKAVLAASKPKFTKQQVERRLAELKDLFDRGLILQDFYDRKVKECEVTP